jgi:hypothetical protein
MSEAEVRPQRARTILEPGAPGGPPPTAGVHRGRLRVRRRGVRATGAEPGVNYRDVEYEVDLTDTDADPARRGREG